MYLIAFFRDNHWFNTTKTRSTNLKIVFDFQGVGFNHASVEP